MDQLGIRNEMLILLYSDNGKDRRIQSNFPGQRINGGKNTTVQTGIRVPLIAHWKGKIRPGLQAELIEASDFLPTLASLAGKPVTEGWQIDGVSFAPQLMGQKGTSREWAFLVGSSSGLGQGSLQALHFCMMRKPMSRVAKVEVNAFGVSFN